MARLCGPCFLQAPHHSSPQLVSGRRRTSESAYPFWCGCGSRARGSQRGDDGVWVSRPWRRVPSAPPPLELHGRGVGTGTMPVPSRCVSIMCLPVLRGAPPQPLPHRCYCAPRVPPHAPVREERWWWTPSSCDACSRMQSSSSGDFHRRGNRCVRCFYGRDRSSCTIECNLVLGHRRCQCPRVVAPLQPA